MASTSQVYHGCSHFLYNMEKDLDDEYELINTPASSGPDRNSEVETCYNSTSQRQSAATDLIDIEAVSEETHVTCITATCLIPGRGNPLHDAAILIKCGKIIFLGPQSCVKDHPAFSARTHVPFLLPGLWDCHTHFTGILKASSINLIATSPATCGAIIARSFHDTLMSGFTSVRDVGSFAIEAHEAVKAGLIIGPTVYGSGAAISQTGGSCDCFELPYGLVHASQGLNRANPEVGRTMLAVADGVDDCRKMVRLQLRRGAKIIKVCASGGVFVSGDDPQAQQFSHEELKVISEEAKRANRGLAVHAHGKPGIMAALEAGCTSIEHGTWLDEEAIQKMLQKDVILVATRKVVEEGMKHLDQLTPIQAKKMAEVAEIHKSAYASAVKRGVKIALGTDLVNADPESPTGPGKSGAELTYAVDAGLSPLQAIEAATANAAESLGPQTPKSGQIRVGYDADLIAVSDDPLQNIRVFEHARNVKYVWKAGVLIKSPK